VAETNSVAQGERETSQNNLINHTCMALAPAEIDVHYSSKPKIYRGFMNAQLMRWHQHNLLLLHLPSCRCSPLLHR
jgi:hypothetical protein